MASGQPAAQTLVLRVSIHCHGCKKKVRKVLKSIQGVQDVEVDARQHKVLVTGTVDAETLVKRLCKSGKQAVPWQHEPVTHAPEAPAPATPAEDGGKDAAPTADKKPAESVKEPQADDISDKKPEQETALEKTPETDKEAESEKEEAKPSDGAKKDGDDGEGAASDAKEAGSDEHETKKKQSKPDDAPAADRSLSPTPAPEHAHHEFNPYNAPQPVMSYHTAQPRASVSYYAPQPEQGYSMRQQPSQPQPGYSSLMHHPPPAPQQVQPMKQWSPSYLYMPYPHASPESYYQDYYSPPGTHAPPPLQDSYRLFDDKNPNSCSVM